MSLLFDAPPERRGTDSLKYDFAVQHGMPEDVLPLWVADMDFQAPPAVLQALEARIHHGIFGYSDAAGDNYFNALSGWLRTHFDWEPQPRWLIKTPGVVFALCAAIRAFTEEGDTVLIQPPVYYPFARSILSNGRKLVTNPLVEKEGNYRMDLEDFEQKIVENSVKLFILCSPHNPVGRVWTREELAAVGDICVRHNVIVVSDEIHADFTLPGYRHHIFADVKPEFTALSVVCTAPSKTFNMAGLQISNIFVPNQDLRRRFRAEVSRVGYDEPNVMGLIACRAAYEGGGAWLEELKSYLLANLNFLRTFVSERLPGVRLAEPEGTYLAWLDFRELKLSKEALEELIIQKAGLWLDPGTLFGEEGEGFQRINLACSRALLQEALEHLERAVLSLDTGK